MTQNKIKENLGKGINVSFIYTDKFKSNLLSFFFINTLNREDVTYNALLPMVLSRGSKKYNNFIALERELERLYGANFDYDVYKVGEKQIIKFTLEWADSKYTNSESFDEMAIEVLFDIIFNPLLKDGLLLEEYVEQEKANLKKKINNRINDKRSYAISRCIEEMCKSEKFGIYSLGYEEDLEFIDNHKLTDYYKNMVLNTPIEMVYVGNHKNLKIDKFIPDEIKYRENVNEIPRESIKEKSLHRNHIVERLKVNQGKLVLGLLTGIPYEDESFEALTLGNIILGGSPNSKLFREVREKNSLAYYANSMLFKHKSIIIIDSGVDFKNMQKALDLINEQIKSIKEADFSEKDIELAKKEIITSLRSVEDSNHSITSFEFDNIITSNFESIEDRIKKINNIKKDEIVSAFNKVSLDTIYVLTREGEEDVDVTD
ncbi:MAG: insulinase family protein [Tissierellales bacterium]|nr:insulinase family protein [Tissierellales bacterium]